MAVKKKKTEEYTADKIEVLEGLEAVRVRPGMYIGTTDKAGLHHLVYEIADNSIDEALAGYCTHVTVSIEKDGSCMVQDNGRGMPVDKHPKLGIPAVEVIHTVLHAGGKFGGGGYKVSGGLHGVGASVVNALSEKMIVEVSRNEKKYKIEFSKGKTTSKLKKTGTSKKSGSKTQFWPDPEIFDSIEFDYDTLRKRFKEAAFLTKGLKITVQDKRKGKEKKENFCYTGGLKEFVKELNDGKGPIARDIFYCEEANEDLSVEVAMQYTKKYSSNMMSYANCIMTPEGGTHLSGFKSALTRAVNDFARSKKILKKNDDALTGDDVREGVTAVISVKLGNPQFEGQTKTKLGNSEVKGFVSAAVYKNLSEYFRDNDALARKIAGKCIKAAKAREAAKKARDLARKKNAAASATTLPGKLADCSSKKAKECEIFLVEGDSAGGSAKQGRDRNRQAVLPLRGKILNVEKANQSKILGSEEIKNMITAFGCGIGKECDINKLRYHKIIIMTDADVDGAHIRTLLLTFFFRFMRPLIENGYVYAAQPPLYRVKQGKTIHYTYSDAEQDALLKKLEKKKTKIEIQRYKGLGEMDYNQLWETTMDYKNRTLVQIALGDAKIADETFSLLMGSQVQPRREFIENNAKYATIDA